MEKLTEHTLGCKLKGPKTVQCDHCAFAKAVERPSRRPINAKPTQPFHTLWMDWFDLKEGWDGYQWDSRRARRVCLFQCVASRFVMAYTFEGQKGEEVLTLLKACLKRLERQHGYKVKVIRADMELLKTNATAPREPVDDGAWIEAFDEFNQAFSVPQGPVNDVAHSSEGKGDKKSIEKPTVPQQMCSGNKSKRTCRARAKPPVRAKESAIDPKF